MKFLADRDTDSLDVMLYLSQRKRHAYTAEFNAVIAMRYGCNSPKDSLGSFPACPGPPQGPG